MLSVNHSDRITDHMAASRRKPPAQDTRVVHLEDLVKAAEVADMLGLKHARSVSVYRWRYPSFPAPVMTRPDMWWRHEIEAWREANPGRAR